MIFLSRITVVGHSMEPTIASGQSVIVSGVLYLFKRPKIGDIVLLKRQEKKLLKRIIEIKDKKYFVAGDNVRDSLDSKKFGWIAKDQIIGKLIYKL